MANVVQPYLFFGGRCEEALAFYTETVGAQIDMVMHFDQSPEPVPAEMLPPGFEKKVMHSSFRIGSSTIMASDGCSPGANFAGFSLALVVPTVAEAERAFHALAEGGTVTMPLMQTFWAPSYGKLFDRFGVDWQVMAMGEQAH